MRTTASPRAPTADASVRHAVATDDRRSGAGGSIVKNDIPIPYKVMAGNVGSVGKRGLACRFDGGTPVALESGEGAEIHA